MEYLKIEKKKNFAYSEERLTKNWVQHISEISSKATKTLGFLGRNLAFAHRSTKEVAYKTLVWPRVCSTHLEPLLKT